MKNILRPLYIYMFHKGWMNFSSKWLVDKKFRNLLLGILFEPNSEEAGWVNIDFEAFHFETATQNNSIKRSCKN
jgi:hypothetical protein